MNTNLKITLVKFFYPFFIFLLVFPLFAVSKTAVSNPDTLSEVFNQDWMFIGFLSAIGAVGLFLLNKFSRHILKDI